VVKADVVIQLYRVGVAELLEVDAKSLLATNRTSFLPRVSSTLSTYT